MTTRRGFAGPWGGRLTAAVALLLVLLLAPALWAADRTAPGLFDPVFRWKILTSAHFRLYYPEEQLDLARKFLSVAEDVHHNLLPMLKWEPKEKVDIVLMDSGDSANGLTQVYPYNRVMYYAAPPDSRSELNDYDDWMRVLVAHEHTHTLHLDNKSGLPAVINLVFGHLYNPNLASPHFVSEGYAVYSESRESQGGRLRSAIYDMYLRMDVLSDDFLTLDQMSNTVTTWPFATDWYLYGSSFMQYLGDRFGEDIFGAYAYLYGRQVIPFGMSSVMKKVTGYDYPALYEDWKTFVSDRYRRQAELISRLPLTVSEPLTDSGGSHAFVRMMPGDTGVVYFSQSGSQRPGFWRHDFSGRGPELMIPLDSSGGAVLTLDGRELIFSKPSLVRNRYYYHDLYAYDMDSGAITRLTHDQRAVMPAVDPYGRLLAYVSYGFARSDLVIFDRRMNTYRFPLPPERFDQVFDPCFSPDGRYVVFSAMARGGYKDLYRLEVGSGEIVRLTQGRAIEIDPVFDREGRHLYYSTDLSGVYNVVRRDMETGETVRVTNVLGGAFSPAPLASGEGLAFVDYSHRGYDVALTRYPPHFAPPLQPDTDLRGSRSRPEPGDAPEMEGPIEYSPFPSAYPHLWIPASGQDYAGATLGILVEGSDATASHIWSAEVDYGLYSNRPQVVVGYANGWWPIRFSVSGSYASQRLKDAAVKDGQVIDYDESFYNFSLGASYSFGETGGTGLFADYSHGISLSYSLNYSRGIERFGFDPAEGEFSLPETGLNSGVSLGWSFGDSSYEPFAIGTAWGKGISLSVSLKHRALGSGYNSVTFNAGASYYVRIPRTQTHSLAFRALAGMAAGDYTTRRYFYLGGPPPVNIVSDLLYNNRQYGIFLRGYPSYSIAGDRFGLLKSEYRFALWDINRGFATYPLFFQRLHAAVFCDVANAWGDSFDFTDTKVGVGAELRLDIVLGYYIHSVVRAGYAYGLQSPGGNRMFFMLDNLY